MVRGTFANVRLKNLLAPGTEGGVTRHLPDGALMSIFDASEKYAAEGVPLVILAGKEYGSGSSRDWAAKGPRLLGVRFVIAESYERIHRSNLVGMGIVPLEFPARRERGVAGADRRGGLRDRRPAGAAGGRLRAGPRADRARDRRRRQGQGAPHDRAHRYAAGDRLLPARRHPALRAAPARVVVAPVGRRCAAPPPGAATVGASARSEPLDDPP